MRLLTRHLRAALAGAALAVSALPAAAVELVMVEQNGCSYCARWNTEIAPIYPKTAEGAFAPLRRIDIRSRDMDTLGLQRRVNFTPTFVLIDDAGAEMARLEGYPGEDFFWGLLERMLLDRTDYVKPPESGG